MKKLISFDDIAQNSKEQGLDGAINVAFPGCCDVQKEGLIGVGFGTVVVGGEAWDWILKADHYLFISSE
jgi:hypothetical protein